MITEQDMLDIIQVARIKYHYYYNKAKEAGAYDTFLESRYAAMACAAREIAEIQTNCYQSLKLKSHETDTNR